MEGFRISSIDLLDTKEKSNRMNLDDLPRSSKIVRGTVSLPTLPDKIHATYKDDYDIFEVHRTVAKFFDYQRRVRLPEAQKELDFLVKTNNNMMTYIDQKELEEKISSLKAEIHDISENIQGRGSQGRYINECRNYLKVYQELRNTTATTLGEFLSTMISKPAILLEDGMEFYEYRHEIIRKYLQIAGRYFPMDIIRIYESSANCICGSEEDFGQNASGSKYCVKCGSIKTNYVRTFSSMDTGITSAKKDDYEGLDNFKDALMEFQGKQSKFPPEKVYNELDIYFKSYNLPTRARSAPETLDERGRRPGTSKMMMYQALLKTSNSAYYNMLNYICHKYWGWQLPDLSALEAILIDDYQRTQIVWRRIPDDKKSNPLIQYRLFKHLQARDFPCYQDDFKIVVSDDVIRNYDNTWKMMIEGAEYPADYPRKKLKFIPTV